MKCLIILIISFFSLVSFGQTDTTSVAKPRDNTIELLEITDEEYQNRLNAIQSNYGRDDKGFDDSNSKISVVSADKFNVVYRGLPNPISISVPNAKFFEATAPGLSKLSEGRYNLSPGSGLETIIIVYIVLNDGTKRKEAQKFKIVNIPPLELSINTTDSPFIICSKCIFETTKSDLKHAIFKLNLNRTFLYETDLNISSISFELPNQNPILNEGVVVSEEVFNKINELKKGTVFTMKISLQGNTEIVIPKIKAMLAD